MNKRSAYWWGLVLACGVFLNPMVSQAQESDPDIPRFAKPVQTEFTKEEFMTRRAEGAGLKRGMDKDSPVDPIQRINAISLMQAQQAAVLSMSASPGTLALTSAWTEIGPNPIPNAQVVVGPQTAGSGRTIAIAVHPTNPNLVYVGTAQGGLYRSTDGGAVWTAMMDNALSLAIGTIAIAPSQPDTIFVGTGEANFSSDSFFGVGIYRIDNASSATPIISGPIGGAEFTGRAVSKIVVHPTDANTIFAASASGVGGIGASANNVLVNRGLFRSNNALSAAPTFTRLTGLNANANASVHDFVIDPLNPNLLIANEVAGGGTGGIYVSTDALAASPTFTQTFIFNSSTTSLLTAEFAIHHISGPNPTIYAATGNPASGSTTVANGRLLRSVDGGTTWTTQITNGFCGTQCFYDIAVAVDPIDPATVYLGGNPALVFGRSTDSGVTFTTNATTANGLHGDSHAIAVAPSLPSTIYFGSDGGIYKSTDSGTTWVSLNNTTFKATQFISIAVHPIDPNFSIGGTQDNGTNFYKPDGTWTRADFGDGGYALIDQSAVNTTSVNMYHTYFNNSTLQGYGFVSSTASASEGSWTFRGCNGSAGNGIPCGGAVLFYAPLEQGPGSPNTLYYGANILYRSSDTGLTHTAVSQNLTTAISAIGISRQNDNVRIVGQANGGLFGTTTGSATLTNLDVGGVVPNNFIARAVIDPNNVNTAYVTLSAFGVVNVWRTSDLGSANPAWTAVVGSGANILPQVPVSAFLVDPASSTTLYAGTDIGVYISTDAGANWTPFGTGLPRVAVFDMAKTSGGLIRIATHGRGMWQIPAFGAAPTPIIAATTATLVSESFVPANAAVDPGEAVTVSFAVQNIGSANTVNDVGTLQATGGVTAPGPAQAYGVVVAGGPSVSRNFTFTADPALACGANITATVAHVDGATNLGNSIYTLATGVVGATTTTSYSGPPVAIPDNSAAGVNIVLPVSGVVGLIGDLNFRLDSLAGCNNTIGNANASVTHNFLADLAFKLTSPTGTTVNLITSRGSGGANFCTVLLDDDSGFPATSTMTTAGAVAGNFAPDSALSAFDGQNANGNWTLNVADNGATDTGTLNRFSLIITGRTCAAPVAPVAVAVTGNGSSTVGADVTFIATLSGGISPTGSVAFKAGGTNITGCDAQTVTSNVASCTTSALPVGSTSITAVYSGDTNNASATSPAVTQTINQPSQTLTVTVTGTGQGNVTGTGINCPGDCTEAVVQGTMITLAATPATGSIFAGWSGSGCTGTSTCTVNMSSAQSVSAQFTRQLGALSVTLSGLPDGGSVALAVTGPDVYSTSNIVTTGTTLNLTNLPTGTYSVNAPSKTIIGVYYQPTATRQSVLVTVGMTAAVTVTYSVAVPPLIPIVDFMLD